MPDIYLIMKKNSSKIKTKVKTIKTMLEEFKKNNPDIFSGK
jgi:hypothetical protein